jgi:4-amino-4-deoxy-L-arabinose transferase-like glycosyltransferase
MVAPLGVPASERTQEGRVLQTALEMLDATSVRDVLVPRMNGELRLQKPPLAYWLAAGSLRVFGVNEFAGRLPFALASWLTGAVVYAMGRRLWGRGVGFFAGAALLGTFFVARYGRLAETDSLVMLFTALAIYATWRGLEPELFRHRGKGGSESSPAVWFNIGAVAIGLCALAKGLPAGYPLLFMLVYLAVRRRWGRLGAWFMSGAPLLALVISASWFVYIMLTIDTGTLVNEVRVVAVGAYHRGTALEYFAILPLTVVPWVGFTGLALWMAAHRGRWRRDPRVLGVMVWGSIIMIVLCLAGQKQKHYLIPLMPPLALLTGWSVMRIIRARAGSRVRDIGELFLTIVIIACAAAAVAPVIAGPLERGSLRWYDPATALVLAACAVFVWYMRRAAAAKNPRRGLPAGLAAMACASVVVLSVTIGWWGPSMERNTSRDLAAALVGTFGERPMCYYPAGSPYVAFATRRVIPVITEELRLVEVLRADPSTVVLVETKPSRTPTALPPMLHEALKVPWGDQFVVAYATTDAAPAATSTSAPATPAGLARDADDEI